MNNNFTYLLEKNLGIKFYKYQEYVVKNLLLSINKGERFVIVAMPTGSGKTLIEMYMSYWALENMKTGVLVLEPTRFLCDQMYSKLWSKVFSNDVYKVYDGELPHLKNILLSTPQTALKNIDILKDKYKVIIIDEVHHAFGGKLYTNLLEEISPNLVVGFTALLPTHKRYKLDPGLVNTLGDPYIFMYDFKKLAEVDPKFMPPKAIADLFDASMNEIEDHIYNRLFCGSIEGESRIIKFLEITFAHYGKAAFCESLWRAYDKGKVEIDKELEELCERCEYSHKARVIREVLTAYQIGINEIIKPVIIFTSRKRTAYEMKNTIANYFPKEKVQVLTSDMRREERLKLIKKAKSGEVDVIVSTLVGEEGVDIPEAGLLIMSDAPKSSLRFYQRLGRLIRISSPGKIKYLVVTLTPKTIEYKDLEKALWNLYSENVDISYILINIDAKSFPMRIVDLIESISKIYDDIAIPYTLITYGRELSDPITFLMEKVVKPNREIREKILKGSEWYLDEIESANKLYDALFILITGVFFDEKAKILKKFEKILCKSRLYRQLDKAIRDEHIFYIYDVDKISDLISHELENMYNMQYYENKFFRLDRKSIARLFMNIFEYKNISKIEEKLIEIIREYKKLLPLEVFIYAEVGSYNPRGKYLPAHLHLHIGIDSKIMHLLFQINYFDITENRAYDEEIHELIKMNLKAIGYKAALNFMKTHTFFL